MSRHHSAGSRGHRIIPLGDGVYRLVWMVDRYYEGSRLRYPREGHRDTNAAGAARFAVKHNLTLDISGEDRNRTQLESSSCDKEPGGRG